SSSPILCSVRSAATDSSPVDDFAKTLAPERGRRKEGLERARPKAQAWAAIERLFEVSHRVPDEPWTAEARHAQESMRADRLRTAATVAVPLLSGGREHHHLTIVEGPPIERVNALSNRIDRACAS